MTLAEAEAILRSWFRRSTATQYSSYGYDLYIPTVIRWHTTQEHPNQSSDPNLEAQNIEHWSPAFAEAAWDLARRGILRPGVRVHGQQSTEDGSAGYGFSLTSIGQQWIQEADPIHFVPTASHRFSELLGDFRSQFGEGYFSRSQEAVRCFQAMAYLACCAMCGAAAESIMLAAAAAKTGDEDTVLEKYRSAQGRSRVRNLLVGAASRRLQADFDTFLGLLNYWRDEAAHGVASNLGSTEAELGLVQLCRFAVFMKDNWEVLARLPV